MTEETTIDVVDTTVVIDIVQPDKQVIDIIVAEPVVTKVYRNSGGQYPSPI